MKIKHILLSMIVACSVVLTPIHAEEKTLTLNLNKIISVTKAASLKDQKINAQREARFNAEKNKQQGRLTRMKNALANQERISKQLEASFNVNDTKIKLLADELAKEMGDLKELFGVIQQTASDAQEDYKTSFISAQFPDRAENLRKMVAKMGNTTQLISLEEIEDMWFQLQNEMTEQGKIVKFAVPVSYISGQTVNEKGESVNVHS